VVATLARLYNGLSPVGPEGGRCGPRWWPRGGGEERRGGGGGRTHALGSLFLYCTCPRGLIRTCVVAVVVAVAVVMVGTGG